MLTNHPTAFSSSPEDCSRPSRRAQLRMPNAFPTLARTDVLFGAYADGEPAPAARGFMRDKGVKEQHKGFMWGVYLRPPLRGTGTAQALVEAVIAQGRTCVELITSAVNAENAGARALYLRMGFEVYGTQPKALRIDGRDYDEDLLVLRL